VALRIRPYSRPKSKSFTWELDSIEQEVGPEFADVPDVVARLQQQYDLNLSPPPPRMTSEQLSPGPRKRQRPESLPTLTLFGLAAVPCPPSHFVPRFLGLASSFATSAKGRDHFTVLRGLIHLGVRLWRLFLARASSAQSRLSLKSR
jgi:hypothetical protein